MDPLDQAKRIVYDRQAHDYAKLAIDQYFHVHRGVFATERFSVIFGNDDISDQVTVSLVRFLRGTLGTLVLGFGVEDEAYSWAMIVNSGEADDLDALVWSAWRYSRGLETSIIDSYEAHQKVGTALHPPA